MATRSGTRKVMVSASVQDTIRADYIDNGAQIVNGTRPRHRACGLD
jgi:hypothetical protein